MNISETRLMRDSDEFGDFQTIAFRFDYELFVIHYEATARPLFANILHQLMHFLGV